MLRGRGGLRCAAAALGLTVAGGAATLAQDGAPAKVAVAVGAHLDQTGEAARLTFDLSQPVEATARTLRAPDRIVVDLPEVNFQLDPSTGRTASGKSDDLVKAFRFGLMAPGKSRVVIDLTRPACVESADAKPVAKGAAASRLTIALRRCDAKAFAAASEPSEAATQPAAPAPTTPRPVGLPVIVLDPGHGGVDGGAYGVGGAVEKTLVWDFASELRRQLEATGRYHVVMTRNGDAFVSLDDRVKIARDANADLLISIHADTLAEAADVSGATVYTVADRASDAEAARIAERENAADKAAGVEGRSEAAGVADILFDLKRRETRTYSHLFSRGLVAEFHAATRLNHNPERSAGFVVLKAPDFPSVLVELGYLSNAKDVQSLSSSQWRGKVAGAMTAAIGRFFADSQPAPAATKTEADPHGVAMTAGGGREPPRR